MRQLIYIANDGTESKTYIKGAKIKLVNIPEENAWKSKLLFKLLHQNYAELGAKVVDELKNGTYKAENYASYM